MSLLTRITTHLASTRTLVSCGDSAPPSTRSSSRGIFATPRAPGCSAAIAATLVGATRVAFINASTIVIA
jgi:hypothetical protein